MLSFKYPSRILLSLCAVNMLAGETPNPVTSGYLELLPIDTLVTTLSLEELTQVVITDTKTVQSRDKVTQKMEIIDQTRFERIGENTRNLAELMQYTSGQFVNVLSRNDANWGSYAGLGPKYNTYMLDGLPIDSFTDAMSLDPWAFERVEIQKGPAAILYSNYLTMDFAGNESPLAGTTNFILRDKIDGEMSRANIGIGSYNTQNTRIYHQNRHGNLSYFVGGNIEHSDYAQYGKENSWLQTTEVPDYQKIKVYGKLAYEVSPEQRISLFYHMSNHDGDTGRPNRDFDHRYHTLNLKYNHTVTPSLLLQIQGGIRDYSRIFFNDNYATSLDYTNTDHYDQTIIPLDVTLSYLHGEGNIFTIGSDMQSTRFTSYRIDGSGTYSSQNDVDALSNGIFLQEKVLIGDWVLRAGLRYNRIHHEYKQLGGIQPSQNEATWNKTLWNVGARYNINPALSLFANSGSGFMTPSAKQVGGTISNPLTDSGQIANANLQSELGSGNDIGFEWHPLPQWMVALRSFYNTVDDAIVDSVISSSPSQTQSFNAGKTVAQGIEIDLEHHVDESMEYFANVTYTDTRIKDSKNSANDGSDIPFVPRYIANLGATAFLPFDITASAYLQSVGKYYDSASKIDRKGYGNYHTLNAKLQKNLIRNRDYSLSALLELNNLGGVHHMLPWDFENTGFNANGTIALSF